ncbi:hypothetical protein FRB90_006149 [Tulasnella sp. 427]|nr:hypothetical protein FRB90_006149 [Tulasnella sp. 427]
MAPSASGKIGIAQWKPQRAKKRRMQDVIQESLLSDPNLISPASLSGDQRPIAPLPSQASATASANQPPSAQQAHSSTFTISTTVKDTTSIVHQEASLTAAGRSDQFQGDPILVEDSPTSVQPEEEEEENDICEAKFNRRSKNGARYRREKLNTRARTFLPQLYRHEGYSETRDGLCAACLKEPAQYECLDCLDPPVLCKSCMIKYHVRLPLHRIRRWSIEGNYGAWEKDSLSGLGLIVRVGHGIFSCPNARADRLRSLQIFDLNGQHEITASFCECQDEDSDQAAMLLGLKLYPATDDLPRIAFTFRLLKHFVLLQAETNCAAASYYDTLALSTDAVDTRSLPFLSCTREWKVLEMVMRACSQSGTDLRAGEATVKCGLCPIPGVNMPENWKDDPDADLLYRVFESFDGNFSLQLKDKGVTEDTDPSVIRDAGYWAERHFSHAYIEKLGGFEDRKGTGKGKGKGKKDEEQESLCQHMRAGKGRNGKAVVNKLADGVVMGCCARHRIVRPNGVVDLPYGERYPNTDCCVIAGLKAAQGLNTAFLTYDIWCKYSVNLEKRLALGGAPSFSELELQVLGAIPKFHIGAHGSGCYPKYSLNFMSNVGRTHGERVEQAWADLGRAKYITREMTPGHRKDTLNGMFSHHNWKILSRNHYRLFRAIEASRKEIKQKEEDFEAINLSLGDKLVSEFTVWDEAHPEPEKYCSQYSDIKPPSQAEILKKLYSEENAAMEDAPVAPTADEFDQPSVGLFVSLALDLEVQRDRLEEKTEQVSESDSTKLVSDWIAAKNRFKSSLSRHYSQLLIHAPPLTHLNLTIPEGDDILGAELYLPSRFTEEERCRYKLESMAKVEQRLRIPQAQEEVVNLRNALGVKAFLIWQGRQTSSTGATGYAVVSRSQGKVKQADDQVKRIARRYRRNYEALVALNTEFGLGCEAGSLQELQEQDLKIASSWTVDEVSTGKRRQKTVKSSSEPIPWLWKTFAGNLVTKDNDQGDVEAKIKAYNYQAIRVEWLVARAELA